MADGRGGESVAAAERRGEVREEKLPPEMDVRDEDMEPHEGLRYIARLFKLLAMLLILLLVGEIILGLMNQGNDAIPTLMTEATRIIVFAGLLWAAADLALMLIESNHDLRATRILVGRLNGKVARLEAASFGPQRPGGTPPTGGIVAPRPAPGAETERPPSHREGQP